MPTLDVNQINLIGAICKHLTKMHGKEVKLTARQMNSIIEAANIVVDALRRDDLDFADNCGASEWLMSEKTGMSSLHMCRVLAGIGPGGDGNFPRDTDDFGRCLGLLRAAPRLREDMHLLKASGPEWSALVDNWQELEASYLAEVPGARKHTNKLMADLFDKCRELKGTK